MNSYLIVQWLHIISAFVLVTPLIFLPKLLYLYQNKKGQALLHKIHLFTGSGGVILFLSGVWMLFLQKGAMLSMLWMILSIVLFIAIQLFDHFWADKQEELLEHDIDTNREKLKTWLTVKVIAYLFIALLMVVQPC